MNKKEFWNKYLNNLHEAIINLCKEKEYLYVDLHMHSNYSSDGKQNLQEIIQNTRARGFDIIAITDHDSVKIYDELFDIVNKKMTKPLIIPGIEFTVDNCDYGSQCHILKLFINPKDKDLLENVKKNYQASYNRSKIQFQRLKENEAIQKIINDYKIRISYSDYLHYLKDKNYVPEYDSLSCYLMDKFSIKKVTTFMVLDLLEKVNQSDVFIDRRKYKSKRYAKLRQKYEKNTENMTNHRFLLSMLAPREVDDDWWNKPSSGSLSVNSYGQAKIEELNDGYPLFFAHPTETKLEIVKKIIQNNPSIIGVEKNYRNPYQNIKCLDNLIKNKDLLVIKGSDSHDSSGEFYQEMNYYKMNSFDIEKIITRCLRRKR